MAIDTDNLEQRCPRLGNRVTFQYCLDYGSDGRLPCWKVIDCWWEIFDILTYLKDNFSEEDVKALETARPKSKITSLVELIEQAKKRSTK
ncbi:MAG: hypothetical protein JRI91_04320 [Deltaproteobacteria bacterium]|nr:hypothetical protein [Deltaproteobacteria bacterium]